MREIRKKSTFSEQVTFDESKEREKTKVGSLYKYFCLTSNWICTIWYLFSNMICIFMANQTKKTGRANTINNIVYPFSMTTSFQTLSTVLRKNGLRCIFAK